jgi:hypothetical protein
MPFVTTQVTHPSDTAQAPVPNVESLPHCGDMENLLSEVVADTSVFQREIVALLYLTAHTALSPETFWIRRQAKGVHVGNFSALGSPGPRETQCPRLPAAT